MCNKRIIPFIRTEKRIKNGKEYEVKVDNLSNAESRMIDCLPKMLVRDASNNYYVMTDLPITYRGTGIKWYLCYDFDDLSPEEQELFADRTVEVTVVVEKKTETKTDADRNTLRRKKNRRRSEY